MKILLVNLYRMYTHDSFLKYLKKMGYTVNDRTYFTPEDFYRDEVLEQSLEKDLKAVDYQAVVTLNYWPVVANVCRKCCVRYISWSYDSPLNFASTETMEFETNRLFLFDRMECNRYRAMGLEHVYYMPLAADCEAMDAVKTSGFLYDVSFIGSLYPSALPALMQPMSAFNQGYIKAVVMAQEQIYGYYMIDEMLTEERMESIYTDYCQKAKDHPQNVHKLTQKELSFAIASHITHVERMTLLSLLSGHAKTALATDPADENLKKELKNVEWLGRLSYQKEMPQLFKQTRINLNPVLRAIQSGIPLRALDILSCGGLLLSSYQPELAEYFVPDQEIVLYDSMEDALAKAQFYLQHENLAEKIRMAGYARVKQDFRYEERIKAMFELAGLEA